MDVLALRCTSGTGVSMCSVHLPDTSSCAWQHFQKEENPGGSAVTARLCHIPCCSSLSSPGFPSSLPASVCLCPQQTARHSPVGSVTTTFPNFPYFPSIRHGEICLSPLAVADRERELPFLLVCIIPQAARNPWHFQLIHELMRAQVTAPPWSFHGHIQLPLKPVRKGSL